jgi:hypothetical protein
MRSLWKLRRVRLYLYTVAGCMAVTAAGGVYAAVRVATAEPLPLPLETIRPPRDDGPLPTIVGGSDRSRIEPNLSGVATAVAGRLVEVRCWSDDGWRRLMRERALYYGEPATFLFGYAAIDERRIQLPGFFCDLLVHIADPDVPRLLRAQAAETFAHELEHVRGVASEQRAECYSYQTMGGIVQALGASKREARALARFAWNRLYDAEDAEYGAADCHDGGALDLRPTSSVWP